MVADEGTHIFMGAFCKGRLLGLTIVTRLPDGIVYSQGTRVAVDQRGSGVGAYPSTVLLNGVTSPGVGTG